MNSPKVPLLILGVGSHHGDDCIGWRVIEELRRLGIEERSLCQLAIPMQILDRIGEASEIHIVDAARGLADDESYRRLSFDSTQTAESLGTHGIGIHEALQFAQSLGQSVDHVVIWLGHGESFAPMAPPSPRAEHSIRACAEAIAAELATP